MRPRHKAAENAELFGLDIQSIVSASMRPRHKAAENLLVVVEVIPVVVAASMRPRHKAAENRSPTTIPGARRSRFNEAAA